MTAPTGVSTRFLVIAVAVVLAAFGAALALGSATAGSPDTKSTAGPRPVTPPAAAKVTNVALGRASLPALKPAPEPAGTGSATPSTGVAPAGGGTSGGGGGTAGGGGGGTATGGGGGAASGGGGGGG